MQTTEVPINMTNANVHWTVRGSSSSIANRLQKLKRSEAFSFESYLMFVRSFAKDYHWTIIDVMHEIESAKCPGGCTSIRIEENHRKYYVKALEMLRDEFLEKQRAKEESARSLRKFLVNVLLSPFLLILFIVKCIRVVFGKLEELTRPEKCSEPRGTDPIGGAETV